MTAIAKYRILRRIVGPVAAYRFVFAREVCHA